MNTSPQMLAACLFAAIFLAAVFALNAVRRDWDRSKASYYRDRAEAAQREANALEDRNPEPLRAFHRRRVVERSNHHDSRVTQAPQRKIDREYEWLKKMNFLDDSECYYSSEDA